MGENVQTAALTLNREIMPVRAIAYDKPDVLELLSPLPPVAINECRFAAVRTARTSVFRSPPAPIPNGPYATVPFPRSHDMFVSRVFVCLVDI